MCGKTEVDMSRSVSGDFLPCYCWQTTGILRSHKLYINFCVPFQGRPTLVEFHFINSETKI